MEVCMTQARMWRWLLAGVMAVAATVAQADDALWALLQKGGQVVMLRHALTDPGVGDPPPGIRRPPGASAPPSPPSPATHR